MPAALAEPPTDLKAAEDLLADGSLTVAAAVKEFGIGRTQLYLLMGRGDLPYSARLGRRLIPRRSLRRLIAESMVGMPAPVK